jgi:hypothetical protein
MNEWVDKYNDTKHGLLNERTGTRTTEQKQELVIHGWRMNARMHAWLVGWWDGGMVG